MTVGAAGAFAMLADGPLRLAALLGVAFGLGATVALSLWCAAGMLLGRVLRSEAQWRLLNGALGALLALSIVPTWL